MGVLACLVGFAEFPLWFVGESMPRFWDAAAFAAFAARHGTLYLTRTLMDLLIFGLLLFFFGGFRHLVVLTRASYEWLATTFFGVAVVYVAVTLVSDALAATAAIDVADGRGDPTVIRTLNESTLLLFGSVAESLVVTLTIVAAVLILRTRALPRWTAWLALVTAGVNLSFVPTMYFGADFTKYYSAAGDGPAATAPMMFILWILATSICMLRTKTATAGTTADTLR
jgi:hypothetical protein